MLEITGNLWEVGADLRVVTTNGIVRSDGACVMGRGCALEAKTKFPGIEFRLGGLIQRYGNRVMRLGRYDGVVIASYPVKHHWKDSADPVLIRRSAEQLVGVADKFGHGRVVIPRPGCGNGKLGWADVRSILSEVLDDRFSVITFPPKPGKKRTETKPEKQGWVPGRVRQERIDGPCQIEVRAYGSPDEGVLSKVPARYVFCGSRGWDETHAIKERLQALPVGAIVVVGGARGADKIAEQIARRLGMRVEVYPARWDEEGRGAGYRRNERMLGLPKVAGVFAFRCRGKSNGTDHMVRISREAGIEATVQMPAKMCHILV